MKDILKWNLFIFLNRECLAVEEQNNYQYILVSFSLNFAKVPAVLSTIAFMPSEEISA